MRGIILGKKKERKKARKLKAASKFYMKHQLTSMIDLLLLLSSFLLLP